MTTSPQPVVPQTKWYYQGWFVLLMLTPFFLGPFGLPLLWRSPKFSRRAQWLWTVVTIAWTLLFIIYVMRVVVPAITNSVNQINASLQF